MNDMSEFRDITGFRQGYVPWPGSTLCLVSLLGLSLVISTLSLFPSVDRAFGHAFVLDINPSPSETLESPPVRVEVFLSEPVDDRYSEVRVIGPQGKQIDNRDTQHLDGDQSTLGVTIPQEDLEDGVYTVSTKMLSQIDGHVTDNSFVFGIGEETSTSSTTTTGQTAQGSLTTSSFDQLSVPDAIARFPALVGQVIVVGAAFASLWLWSPFAKVKWLHNSFSYGQDYGKRKQNRTQLLVADVAQFRNSIDQRLVKMMLIGAAIVVIADFGMIYALAYSLNVGMIDAMTTKFGDVWFARTAVSFLMLALIFFIYLKVNKRVRLSKESAPLGRTSANPLGNSGIFFKRELVAILVVGILTLLTTSLMGHGAAIATGSQIPITIDFIHNVAASTWIGGLIYLALVVVPKLKDSKSLNERLKSSVLSIIIPRFSTLPVVVLGIIIITGPVLLYILEDDLNLTIASLYGKALLAKLIIAAIMLAIGGYNQRIIYGNALNRVTLQSGTHIQQQVVISKLKADEKSSSPSSSSSSLGPGASSREEEEDDRSQNRLALLLKNLGQKAIARRREQYSVVPDHNNSDMTNLGKGRKEHDHSDDWSKRNPSVSWPTLISRFNKSTRIEAVLGIFLLGAVAVLTNTGLPASEFQGQLQQQEGDTQATDIQELMITTSSTNNGIGQSGGSADGVGGYSSTQYLENATARIKLTIEPFAIGNNNFEIEFLDSTGNPIDMRTAEMKMTQTAEGIGPIEIQTEKAPDGVFTANASFGLTGEWELFIEGVRNEVNAPNLATTFNVFVKPDLDQIEYSVTQIAMPSNGSQPLYPVYDGSRNSIWVGDTALDSRRIFEYDIANNEFREHIINGTNIITTIALDSSNGKLWFIDPITKVLGLYDPEANSSQLYNFPNDRIVPSSIAVRSADYDVSLPTIDSRADATADGNGTVIGNEGNVDRISSNSETVWITSPSTNELLLFDTVVGNFTNSLSLPTPNSNPLGITIDSATGQIWVAEGVGKIANIDPANNFTINEFTPTTANGQENDTLLSPTALLIDPYTGVIYISEHDGHVVSVFNPVFRTFSDFPPLGEDALPFGMALDKDRNLWVAEHVTNRIAVIDPSNGKYKEVTIPSPSPFVQFVTSDNDGRVWFAAQRGNALGYVTSSVNFEPSPSSSSSGSEGRGPDVSNEAITSSNTDQTPLSPLFNIGYEYLISPLIALGVIASSAFYVNSVISLKNSIQKVNSLSTDSDTFAYKFRGDRKGTYRNENRRSMGKE
jgi:putative copper export protein/streptogramin lyase/methionine-rich copper-binding protein CopC